ncbi:serine hydrolase domain-containing protein [Nocardiopsis prasina]|uniref:serine hydrolase domain-containing protein n=1 Tax=Nocardiopsis prasina TaxID=2015 RepID=UPI00034C3D7B|nr:serine hydrolase domain-containing protein [Nocardiopsis prasina]
MTSVGSPPTAHPAGPPPGTPARKRRAPAAPRRVWLIALVAGAVVAVLTHLFAPAQAVSAPVVSGDTELTEDLEAVLGDRAVEVQGLSVGRFDLDEPTAVEWAAAGTADGATPVDEHTPFETGSVFKVVTGMLLADMVADGETSLDRTLGEVLPEVDFADPETATITLEELATHQSGLPGIPTEDLSAPSFLVGSLVRADPYLGFADPLDRLATASPVSRGEYVYSNHGMAVLGGALAAEAGTTYPELARERVLDPLGLEDTVIAGSDLPAGAAWSHHSPGVRITPWTNSDYAAAGAGTWSTTADLAVLIAAVTAGSAPGADSVEPVPAGPEIDPVPGFGELESGLAWLRVTGSDGGTLIMHNGKTYGASTMVGYDGEQAVVLMSNSGSFQEMAVVEGLLDDQPGESVLSAEPTAAISAGLTLLLLIVPPVLLLALAVRRRTLVTQRPIDRLRIVSLSLGNLAWLTYLQHIGVWTDVPNALFAWSVGVAAAAASVLAWHFVRVPVEAGRFRWLHVPVFALSVLLSLTVLSASVYALAVAHL